MSTLGLVPVHVVPDHKPVPTVPVHTTHGGCMPISVHCAAILLNSRPNLTSDRTFGLGTMWENSNKQSLFVFSDVFVGV